MKNTQVSVAQPVAEEIVLEGRCVFNSATGMHQVLTVSEDEALQTLLNSDLALVEDSQAASGLRTRNHSGYNPYDRPNAASKNPKDIAPRPRMGAKA